MLEEQFLERITKHNETLSDLEKKHTLIGNLKVLTFIVFVISIVMYINNFFPYKVIPLLIFLLLLFFFFKQHLISNKMNYSKEQIKINEKYISRINGSWVDFEDIGFEFINDDHPFLGDLDIVGKKSLFQLINVTKTFIGRNILANNLSSPEKKENIILENQEATRELSEKINFRNDFEFFASKIKFGTRIESLISYLSKSTTFINNKVFKKIINFIPCTTILLLMVFLLFNTQLIRILVITLLLTNCIVYALGFTKVNKYFEGINKFSYDIKSYKPILNLIEKEDFESAKLKSIKNDLFNKNSSSLKAISDLSFIVEMMNMQHSFVIHFLLNIFFLWDFNSCILLEKWKTKYSTSVSLWFNGIGEIESLMSFSVLNNTLNNFSYPAFALDKVIKAEEIGHPLLNNKERVNNDFTLDNKIIILSGSNMSGKTTFLRTIGINLVLAYNGSVVCAKKLETPIINIVTSMRIADDLKEGVSTFYAELLKIKRIIEIASESEDVIFLIDEIFRGTNSTDRLFGAKSVLENLSNKNTIGLLTTHDLEICKIEDARIINKHFSEEINDNEILFDYKLRSGVCQTTNAKKLMQMIGIIVD